MKFNKTDYPDGYYILSSKEEPTKVIVCLYAHEDFKGVRHLSFGHESGSALMPISDLRESSTLTPAIITVGLAPTTFEQLDMLDT